MGLGWRRSRQPNPIPKHKTLIVISNEVRNLSQSFIYKVYRTTIIEIQQMIFNFTNLICGNLRILRYLRAFD